MHRLITAGHDGLGHFRRHAESGRTFVSIERPETTAGAGPDIDQPTAALISAHDELHRLTDFPLLAQECRRYGGIFGEHEPDGRSD